MMPLQPLLLHGHWLSPRASVGKYQLEHDAHVTAHEVLDFPGVAKICSACSSPTLLDAHIFGPGWCWLASPRRRLLFEMRIY